jgi:hypothetical protein
MNLRSFGYLMCPTYKIYCNPAYSMYTDSRLGDVIVKYACPGTVHPGHMALTSDFRVVAQHGPHRDLGHSSLYDRDRHQVGRYNILTAYRIHPTIVLKNSVSGRSVKISAPMRSFILSDMRAHIKLLTYRQRA